MSFTAERGLDFSFPNHVYWIESIQSNAPLTVQRTKNNRCPIVHLLVALMNSRASQKTPHLGTYSADRRTTPVF
jgi:hypothetical protein